MILVAIILVTNPRATACVIGVICIYNATRYTIKAIPDREVAIRKIVNVFTFERVQNVPNRNKFFIYK